ncbi:cell division protein FtsQ [Bhargavaea cecembensis]|uniref:Cell division protein FtsQ n=1 Tax=Bhargavaea cecembensis TaxID=394098 RepID=A0A163ET81_9BACL|nr:hypothetical protein [Bhargavaea cecembensis]KZE37136.1 cell division protein FtsQ [Bhargavaea cecembensis]
MAKLSERYKLTQSQKMMVFILSMSLYGLSNMITELIPEVYIGPIEFSVEYFAFIPLTLCILFHPLYAAIGASVGEIIFGELMLGQFGGFGELEKFIAFSLAMYVAGTFVRDPKNKIQVGIAAMLGVIIHQFISMTVDVLKVWVGVEELEVVPGLAESVVIIEGFYFLNDIFFSGILFALLPTVYLVPRLYGKIEPLLGMKPRERTDRYSLKEVIGPRLVAGGLVLASLAFMFEFLSETDFNPVDWEADLGGGLETTLIWVSIGMAFLIAVSVIAVMVKRRRDNMPPGPGGVAS